MSRGPYSILLMLAMSLPSAVRALGLGDIRVDSALNEPLSAQIDIVGATRDELAGLTANVANRDVFQRYGADRPAFLASATFKVGLDAQGHPVLNVRSADPFTDPLVSFLVDLRWGKNEIVREYSLLLDPAGFNPSTSVALAATAAPRIAPAATATATATATAPQGARGRKDSAPLAAASEADQPRALGAQVVADTPAAAELVTDRHYKIAAGDTLRGIARRAGARSEPQLQRIMLAVFRANPGAFEGNINRMHGGVTLTLPTAADLASISGAEAKREIRAQMTAWRVAGRPPAPRVASIPATQATQAAPGVAAQPAAVTPAAAPARVAKEVESPDVALQSRVQFLERALDDMHKQLASEGANIQDLKEAAARGPLVARQPAQAAASPQPILAAVAPQSAGGKAFLGPMALILGVLLAGFAFVRKRMSSRVPPAPAEALVSTDTRAASEAASQGIPASPAVAPRIAIEAPPARTVEAAPVMAAAAPKRTDFGGSIAADRPAKASNETTVSLEIDAEALERSYLDSLGIEATLDTVAVDASELDAEVMNSELDTMVLDMKQAAAKVAEAGLANAQLTDMRLDEAGLDDTKPAGTNKLQTAASDTELDYNLLDLDATAQHVHMPSDLHDRAQVSERRTNIVDVLKVAIDQDPHRRDLRMKLLETYYSAASTNQRAFLEVVRKLKLEREHLSDDDWKKVTMMGRDIAPADPLFNELLKDDDELAHCA